MVFVSWFVLLCLHFNERVVAKFLVLFERLGNSNSDMGLGIPTSGQDIEDMRGRRARNNNRYKATI